MRQTKRTLHVFDSVYFILFEKYFDVDNGYTYSGDVSEINDSTKTRISIVRGTVVKIESTRSENQGCRFVVDKTFNEKSENKINVLTSSTVTVNIHSGTPYKNKSGVNTRYTFQAKFINYNDIKPKFSLYQEVNLLLPDKNKPIKGIIAFNKNDVFEKSRHLAENRNL